MTYALALLCRLAAVELEQAYGAQNIRRTLRDLGWADAAITAAVERVKKAIGRSCKQHDTGNA